VHVWRHLNMLPYICRACDFKTLTVTSIRGHPLLHRKYFLSHSQRCRATIFSRSQLPYKNRGAHLFLTCMHAMVIAAAHPYVHHSWSSTAFRNDYFIFGAITPRELSLHAAVRDVSVARCCCCCCRHHRRRRRRRRRRRAGGRVPADSRIDRASSYYYHTSYICIYMTPLWAFAAQHRIFRRCETIYEEQQQQHPTSGGVSALAREKERERERARAAKRIFTRALIGAGVVGAGASASARPFPSAFAVDCSDDCTVLYRGMHKIARAALLVRRAKLVYVVMCAGKTATAILTWKYDASDSWMELRRFDMTSRGLAFCRGSMSLFLYSICDHR
ncbi:unnamed protein product, partial [Trichogramma brassicae]